MPFSIKFFLTTAFIAFVVALSCAQTKPSTGGGPKPTTFSNDDFEITLPLEWKRRNSQESFEWEDEKGMQEIVVSVLHAKEPMNAEMRLSTAKRLMEIRLKALEEISGGKARLEETQIFEKNEFVELSVRGVDSSDGMQIYTSIVVNSGRAVTFAYYKYPPTFSEEVFRTRSSELRTAMKVH